ncbi:unnamed protein product [Angiostrongylus costaricensis]|uniref:Copper transport protein n=1 Tax=Angiostrongylus costaricensis TaxID=334426 RepID=A0A0R3PJT5_ANGCS|nr:unnamed protein product [Angiostrongylus costaricensis]
MAMGILLEFIRYIRWRIEMSEKLSTQLTTKYATFTINSSCQSYISRLFSASHIVQTLFFGVQQVLGYSLMLVFMTFSIWLGIAVCLGTEEEDDDENVLPFSNPGTNTVSRMAAKRHNRFLPKSVTIKYFLLSLSRIASPLNFLESSRAAEFRPNELTVTWLRSFFSYHLSPFKNTKNLKAVVDEIA